MPSYDYPPGSGIPAATKLNPPAADGLPRRECPHCGAVDGPHVPCPACGMNACTGCADKAVAAGGCEYCPAPREEEKR